MYTGGSDSGSGPSTWRSHALAMIGEETPVTLELSGGIDGYDIDVSVSISSESNISTDNTVLIIAATVDSVHYSGPNGLQDHHATIAGFLTANTGDPITLDGTNDVVMNYEWTLDSSWPNNSTVSWNIENLNIIAFVQNYTTKEILQAEGGRVNNMNNDTDEDGVANADDNCPDTYNPDQADVDGDGAGDACDACDNVNVYVTGNINGDVEADQPVLNILDVLLLLDLVLTDDFPGCTGEVADFTGDGTVNYLDAIFLAQAILNPDGALVGGFDGGSGRIMMNKTENNTILTLSNDREISGFQLDLDISSFIHFDDFDVPQGWVIKAHQNEDRLRIVGMDLSGNNPQSDLDLAVPCKVNEITEISGCCPSGQQIQFETSGIPETIGVSKSVSMGKLYPNPFNPSVSIPISLPYEMSMEVQVFNIQGKLVETIVQNKFMTAGNHVLNWNAADLASGIYFVRIQTPSGSDVRKAYLVK